MSELKFRNNPCEEHTNVITNDDWCPVCLADERDKLRAELARRDEIIARLKEDAEKGKTNE